MAKNLRVASAGAALLGLWLMVGSTQSPQTCGEHRGALGREEPYVSGSFRRQEPFQNRPSGGRPGISLPNPFLMGLRRQVAVDGPYGELIRDLKTHLETVLALDACIDPKTGGWYLSNTSKTTWQSKVYLAQFIADEILHISDAQTRGETGYRGCVLPGAGRSGGGLVGSDPP